MHDPEAAILEALERGERRAATTLSLDTYGPEIMGFLVSRLGHHGDAREVYSSFTEDLWRGLGNFERRVSLRAYCFAIARNAANRYGEKEGRRRRHEVPLSHAPSGGSVPQAHTRPSTAQYLKTDTKQQFAALRASLDEEAQTLLTLRIDKGLKWREIALVTCGNPDADPASLSREERRLRKRFQLTKDKLRQLATDMGLLRD